MPAPLQLDTNIPDWRRQFRGITVCKGPTCGARIGWVIHIDEGRERRVPYNETDGKIHHSTCPDVESFKRQDAAPGMHPCASQPCRLEVPNSKLMCVWHWKMVTTATQQEVTDAYRAKDRRALVDAQRKAIAEVDEARADKANAKAEARPKAIQTTNPPPKPAPAQASLFGGHSQTNYPD